MTVVLLAIGLTIYPSTQLRFGGLPVGPGECFLILWTLAVTIRQIFQPAGRVSLAFSRVMMFWAILLLALSIGMIVGLAIEPFHYYTGIIHDIISFSFVFLLACLFSFCLDDPRERRRALWSIVIFGAASLTLQMTDGFGGFSVPGVDPWFYNRLRGWSLDPNQLGFFAMFVLLLALHLAETASRPRELAAALICAAPAAAAGILSRSDTVVASLMAAGAIYLVLRSITWLQVAEIAPTLRGTAIALGLLAIPMVLASGAPFLAALAERVEQQSEEVYADDGQGELRIHLWQEAYEKGMSSGLLGFGPGPHLTFKSWKMPPPYKFESHNTPLELFTQGGVLALGAFLWLCLSTLHDTWRARLPALAALVMAVTVFSMFHFVVRHPNFWFAIVLCLLEAERRGLAIRRFYREAVS